MHVEPDIKLHLLHISKSYSNPTAKNLTLTVTPTLLALM